MICVGKKQLLGVYYVPRVVKDGESVGWLFSFLSGDNELHL